MELDEARSVHCAQMDIHNGADRCFDIVYFRTVLRQPHGAERDRIVLDGYFLCPDHPAPVDAHHAVAAKIDGIAKRGPEEGGGIYRVGAIGRCDRLRFF